MNKQDKKSGSGIHTVAAASAGAVIGAGVAVAATAVLQNPTARKKIFSTLEEVKEKTMEKMPEALHSIDSKKKISKTVKKVEKKAKKSAKKTIREGAKEAQAVIN